MKKFINKETSVPGARCLTPQQQLWELIDAYQQDIIRKVFRRLKKRDQEDLCYAMVAYIRFRILREFTCPFMQTLFLSFVDLVDGKFTNKNV
ncbi:MAG: hypothetical protein MJZ73_03260 [Bacteroidaceae bacterium]|nr:hypothetical protein [Bacteroidaceae bacterium]